LLDSPLHLVVCSLLVQVSSYDTVGNAMFALTIHALPAGWRHVAVVTSDFHMVRGRGGEKHFSMAAGLQPAGLTGLQGIGGQQAGEGTCLGYSLPTNYLPNSLPTYLP
jgi:hypothetical protein